MELRELMQGDRFKYAEHPNGSTYVKGSLIPGQTDKFYVHGPNYVYKEGGEGGQEVMKVEG